MQSIVSLADTTSNFEERVVGEEAEDSEETTDMDISIIDETELLQDNGEVLETLVIYTLNLSASPSFA